MFKVAYILDLSLVNCYFNIQYLYMKGILNLSVAFPANVNCAGIPASQLANSFNKASGSGGSFSSPVPITSLSL